MGSWAQWWNMSKISTSQEEKRWSNEEGAAGNTGQSNGSTRGGRLLFFFLTVNQTISTSDVFGSVQAPIVHTSYEALHIIRSHRLVTRVSFGHFLEECEDALKACQDRGQRFRMNQQPAPPSETRQALSVIFPFELKLWVYQYLGRSTNRALGSRDWRRKERNYAFLFSSVYKNPLDSKFKVTFFEKKMGWCVRGWQKRIVWEQILQMSLKWTYKYQQHLHLSEPSSGAAECRPERLI